MHCLLAVVTVKSHNILKHLLYERPNGAYTKLKIFNSVSHGKTNRAGHFLASCLPIQRLRLDRH